MGPVLSATPSPTRLSESLKTKGLGMDTEAQAYARGLAHTRGDHSLCTPSLCDQATDPVERMRQAVAEMLTDKSVIREMQKDRMAVY